MNILRRKVLPTLLALLLISVSCGIFFAAPVSAAETITKTVNIAEANKNERGPGYDWQNRYDILTLSGLHIETEDPYGLRLPADCTVILEGKNYIKAAKYGISFSGTIVIKGSGSLVVDAGEIGLYLISQDNTQKIRLLNGKYEISAGKYGVFSDASDFSFVGKSMKITVPDGAPAIQGRCVNLLGGSFTANGAVQATHALVVDGVNLDVTASAPALDAKNLTVKNIALSGGGEYAGENSISATSTAKIRRTSAVFGEEVPGWVDIILLVVVTVGVAAGIFGPAMRRKKKKQELYERLAREGYDVPEEK